MDSIISINVLYALMLIGLLVVQYLWTIQVIMDGAVFKRKIYATLCLIPFVAYVVLVFYIISLLYTTLKDAKWLVKFKTEFNKLK